MSGLKIGNGITSSKSRYKSDIMIATGTYDFDFNGGAIGNYIIGTIPDNAIIIKAFYEVITTCTDGTTDAATIAISTSKAINEIVAATAISDVSDIWDAGYHDTICDGTADDFTTKTTAISDIQISVAVAALTDGKIKVYWEYVVSE